MFISEKQLKERLNSPNNLINIIQKKTPESLTPAAISVPIIDGGHPHPPIPQNLPKETNKQRAARLARNEVGYGEKKGEYTVNPNIGNDVVRATIGILSASDSATSKEIQKEFGVTKNQIIGAANSKNLSLQEKISAGKDKVSELALDRLMDTLGLLTADKLTNEKPKDLANIASSMAKVVHSMSSSKHDSEGGNKISLTVVAPPMKDISAYTIVDV